MVSHATQPIKRANPATRSGDQFSHAKNPAIPEVLTIKPPDKAIAQRLVHALPPPMHKGKETPTPHGFIGGSNNPLKCDRKQPEKHSKRLSRQQQHHTAPSSPLPKEKNALDSSRPPHYRHRRRPRPSPTMAQSTTSTTIVQPLMQPVTTARLPPHKWSLPHGSSLRIESSGHLTLKLLPKGIVMRIRSDGLRVDIYKSGSGRGKDSSSWHGESQNYSLAELPTHYRGLYSYVARLVDLIRAKTPKVSGSFPYLDADLFP